MNYIVILLSMIVAIVKRYSTWVLPPTEVPGTLTAQNRPPDPT